MVKVPPFLPYDAEFWLGGSYNVVQGRTGVPGENPRLTPCQRWTSLNVLCIKSQTLCRGESLRKQIGQLWKPQTYQSMFLYLIKESPKLMLALMPAWTEVGRGLVITMPGSQAWGHRLESTLNPHMQVGLVAIINVRCCRGLSMVLLKLKDTLELIVKRKGNSSWLLFSIFLCDMT